MNASRLLVLSSVILLLMTWGCATSARPAAGGKAAAPIDVTITSYDCSRLGDEGVYQIHLKGYFRLSAPADRAAMFDLSNALVKHVSHPSGDWTIPDADYSPDTQKIRSHGRIELAPGEFRDIEISFLGSSMSPLMDIQLVNLSVATD